MLQTALRLGVLCGVVHVIAPDHLGTLITMSALCTQREAFYIGACWGIGHSVGTILICAVFMALKAFAVSGIDAYEHYGEYFIGASMVFCALYFAFKEHKYLKKQEDGSVAAVGCSCHRFGFQAKSNPGTFDLDANPDMICMPCTGSEMFLPSICNADTSLEMGDFGDTFYTRALPSSRDTQGACIGLLQGICCPTGLVGISFVARMANSTEIAVFLTAFVFFLLLEQV